MSPDITFREPSHAEREQIAQALAAGASPEEVYAAVKTCAIDWSGINAHLPGDKAPTPVPFSQGVVELHVPAQDAIRILRDRFGVSRPTRRSAHGPASSTKDNSGP